MVKVLSIDFDYFIDATSKDRDTYFPRAVMKYQGTSLGSCGRRGI